MSALPYSPEGHICTRCCGANGVHYLTCPTLRLPAGTDLYEGEEQG